MTHNVLIDHGKAIDVGEESSSSVISRYPSGPYTTMRTLDQMKVVDFDFHVQRLHDSLLSLKTIHPHLEFPPESDELFSTSSLKELLTTIIREGLTEFFRLNGNSISFRNEFSEVSSESHNFFAEVRIYVLLLVETDETTGRRVPHAVVYLNSLSSRVRSAVGSEVLCEIRGSVVRQNSEAKDSEWMKARQAVEKFAAPETEELLLRDENGHVFEGHSSNFFVMLRDGSLQTASQGILSGSVRKTILLLAEQKGIPINYECPDLAQSNNWAYAFISSTSRLILPITSITIFTHTDDKEPESILTFGDHKKENTPPAKNLTALILALKEELNSKAVMILPVPQPRKR
ncbi:putative 5-phosphate dependent protein [Blattamonas nauphoetae]|uniref:5-phosphate dependent protein n=1 Tax=Blattamonas nauphoetae TaxID=2049346 RepID=A0ABQ9Y2X3_9EUKA|nr:putative 5-phosphate dependent protein [Blattamonas nauphoetae]